MCVTKELKHLLCQHTDKYTKECLAKSGSFLACFSKCKPITQSTSQYDLCHECRRYWAEHEISEQEASRSYVNYREAHDHDGPLSPTFILSANDTLLRRSGSATGEFGQAMQQASARTPSVDMRSLQNITPMLYGRPSTDRQSSDSSVMTLWPTPLARESDEVQRSESQSQSPSQKGQGRGERREEVEGGGRKQSKQASSSPKGALLLSEDEEGLSKWI